MSGYEKMAASTKAASHERASCSSDRARTLGANAPHIMAHQKTTSKQAAAYRHGARIKYRGSVWASNISIRHKYQQHGGENIIEMA